MDDAKGPNNPSGTTENNGGTDSVKAMTIPTWCLFRVSKHDYAALRLGLVKKLALDNLIDRDAMPLEPSQCIAQTHQVQHDRHWIDWRFDEAMFDVEGLGRLINGVTEQHANSHLLHGL